MRSHVYNYLNILSKKKPDESPFLYDPSNESLLRLEFYTDKYALSHDQINKQTNKQTKKGIIF
jgi:hypothetical protein